MRRAQITAFMILGIVMLFVAGFVFMGLKGIGGSAKKASTNPVENYIDQCIGKTAGYGLYLLGIHGGRIYASDNQFTDDYFRIAYGYDSGISLPSLLDAKADLERYIDENLNEGAHSCIKDLVFFKEQYRSIEVGDARTEVLFADDATIIRIEMPVELRDGDTSRSLKSFEERFPVRYKRIHDFAKEIFGCADDVCLSRNGEISAHLLPFPDSDSEIYSLVDRKSKLANKDYVFMTAAKGLHRYGLCSDI